VIGAVMKISFLRIPATLVLAVTVLLFGACTPLPKVDIGHTTTAKPVVAQAPALANGAIFHSVSYRPLFEDARPRYIGDVLTININEKLTASTQKDSSVSKVGATTANATNVQLPIGVLQGLNHVGVSGGSSSTFDGKGSSDANNSFTGTITVTVIDVLANGNLTVAGEKQLGTNSEVEYIRFSGVVNPLQIQAGNTVSSTQVADARIEMRGKGQTDEAVVMAWLGRFFMTFLPF
jgi:flagellar L-ring protein precursor FlgH